MVRLILTLRLRLLMLWLFTLAVCIALGFMIRDVYQLGTQAQTEKTVGYAQQACVALQTEYARSVKPGAFDTVLMGALLNTILGEVPGLEGGFWHDTEGFMAYAFPTHQGSEPKHDVPSTERNRIETLVRQSLTGGTPVVELLQGTRETVVLTACPAMASDAHWGAWTMARIAVASGKAYDEVRQGLGLLLLFVIGSGLWLGYSFYRWTHHFNRIESALQRGRAEDLPAIALSQDAELDRIIIALNDFSTRLHAAQARAADLRGALERSERFAALGRLAASVAHEVRNPIAAIRLKIENALAQPDKRDAALPFVLREVGRVETIVKSLLARAEPVRVATRDVAVHEWLSERVNAFAERCTAQGVAFDFDTGVKSWRFDPAALGRALDNLLDNALDHTPRGGKITLSVQSSEDAKAIILRVCDDGPGVAAHIRPRLFDPFVSGRPDGVGLGLALAREIAIAHGGVARYVEQTPGACFELEIPCPAS
ncbi:MAG: HAMP domain-containing histidine kinase [Betaproteobacteria bacterium]|nr:HAMP domain-containing histidine kinase [Betaproteobacteria bacterium]